MSRNKKKHGIKKFGRPVPSKVYGTAPSFADNHLSNEGFNAKEMLARGKVVMDLINYGGGLSDMSMERMNNIEEVVKVLFEDLSREDDILRLIKEREMFTADEIREGLAAFDQYHLTLSSGSL